jgi:hypothetical protein
MATSHRHHSAHPPTAVKPNSAVNPKPEAYVPPERAALPPPNPNPSLGAIIGPTLYTVNSRVTADDFDLPGDDCDDDPDDPDCEDDRKKKSATWTY